MSFRTIGDLARTTMLQRHTAQLKAEVQRHTEAMVSGRVTDPAAALRGDLAPLAAIETTLRRIEGWKSTTAEMSLMLGAMQTALSTIGSVSDTASQALLTAAGSGNPTLIDTTGAKARQDFQTAVAALNTRIGDRTLFAGAATERPALASADTILTALEAATAGLTSAADIEAAVNQWFASPAGYYLGAAAPLGPVPIGAGEVVEPGVTAADPAIAQTLAGLALGALLDRGALAGDTAGRADLARRAGEALAENAAARVGVAANLGLAEARVADAAARHGAEATALGLARAGLVAADPYQAASDLEAAQTQLETLYSVTARLSRLSLVDFLR